ncbi:MAG: CDP-glycerol glycerophosphotransferase family protein [Candidatus Margulisiibacteriota bacterium]
MNSTINRAALSQDLIGLLDKIAKTKLENGQSLIEITTFQQISYWWFIRFNLFHAIKSIVSTDKPSKITLKQRMLAKLREPFSLIYDVSFALMCNLLVIGRKRKNLSKKTKVLVTDYNSRWGDVFDSGTNQTVKSNVFLHPVFMELIKQNEFEVVTCSQVGMHALGFRVLFEKLFGRKEIVHRPLEAFWSNRVWQEGQEAKKHFSNIWAKLCQDPNFINLWQFNGFNLWPYIKDELEFCFNYRFPRVKKYLAMTKNLLLAENPAAILIDCEYGGFPHSLIINAKLMGISTLAIQHGNISPFHEAYMFLTGDIAPNADVKSPFYPIPEITAVYGPCEKEFLTKVSVYPENRVVVTGHPRYDFLAKVGEIYCRETILRDFNLSSNKKIIVWTTQMHFVPLSEQKATLRAVMEAVQSLQGEVELLIKMHPHEKSMALYQNACQEYGVKAAVTQNRNIFEVLYAADLVVTKHSTTGTEALILNKPILILNLSGENDLTSYVDEKVAIGVKVPQALLPAIKSALWDNGTRQLLQDHRRQFVFNHCYKIDGLAAQRVVGVLKEMLGLSRQGV